MKKILILLLLTNIVFAIDVKKLVEEHSKALKIYKKDKNYKLSTKILEDASIKDVLDEKPEDLSMEGYVHILNNYGFFLSEDEERFAEAIPILNRVLQLSPKRFSVYVNLGDTYNRFYHKTKDEKYLHKIFYYYENYIKLIDENLQVPPRVIRFLEQKVKFPKLLEKLLLNLENKKYKIQSINHKKCKILIDDLRQHTRFVILKPDIISQSYSDKKIKDALKSCHPFDLNINIKDKSMLTYFSYEEYLEDKKKSYEFSEAKWDFRVYQNVEIDTNLSNGDEFIFYAGGFCPYNECKDYLKGKKFNDKIYFLKESECQKNYKKSERFNPLKYASKVSKEMPYVIRDNKSGKMNDNIDEIEIVEYRGKYYIYRISTIKTINDEFYSLFLKNYFSNNDECNLIEFEVNK